MSQFKMPLVGVLVLALFVGLVLPILAAEATGRIARVNPTKNEIVLTENVKDLTFQLDNSGKVFINGKDSKLADVRPGDEATVTYVRDGQKLTASVVRCTRK